MTFKRLAIISLLVGGASLLGACGGGGSGGGSGGGGSSSIPTASNPAIAPPPSAPVTINSGNQTANSTIAAAAFQSLDGAGLQTVGATTGVTGVNTEVTATDTRRLTIGEFVRRHAEKIKDYKASASVTGAQIVQTIPCSFGGTATFVLDDVSGNASEIFVNCDEGGIEFHGTISSSGIVANVQLGSTVGSPYTISVGGTITIDLSITVSSPAEVLVTQGSFTFNVTFSGTMESDGAGGVVPGFPTSSQVQITGTSLLASDGVNTERLSNFDLTVTDDDTTGTTIDGQFTYANSAIGGSVTVIITTPIHYAPGASRPDAGVLEITTSASSGKIRVTFSSSGVTVEVFADASDASPTDTHLYTWAEFEAFI